MNVRRSAEYVVRHGPETAQERWEAEAGFSPSSTAAEIAGLACAAKLALDTGHEADALDWLSRPTTGRTTSRPGRDRTVTERHTNTPYYRGSRTMGTEMGNSLTLANDGPTLDERPIIDGGFLELVRLGIKPDDDETIRNSLVEVDDTISVDTEYAPGFYRYNGDGYGERDRDDQGAPWTVEREGKGRLWPLLTGERAEYELHRDDPDIPPENALQMMQDVANSGRMIAERSGTEATRPSTTGSSPKEPARRRRWRGRWPSSCGWLTESAPASQSKRPRSSTTATGSGGPTRPTAAPRSASTRSSAGTNWSSPARRPVRVVVKTPADITYIPVDDREFEVAVDVDPGENR